VRVIGVPLTMASVGWIETPHLIPSIDTDGVTEANGIVLVIWAENRARRGLAVALGLRLPSDAGSLRPNGALRHHAPCLSHHEKKPHRETDAAYFIQSWKSAVVRPRE
jgi:hypothetical protein